jgi:DNA-binding NtrC family response regulator
MSHPWHGNVRELQNAIQKIVISGAGKIEVLNQPAFKKTPTGIADIVTDDEMNTLYAILMEPDGRGDGASKIFPYHTPPNGDGIFVTLEQLKIRYVQDVLKRVGGNKSAAATLLGISRQTLRKKLRKLSERRT